MVKNLEWDPGFPVPKLQPSSWQEFSILHWNWLLFFFHFKKPEAQAGRENQSLTHRGRGLLPAARVESYLILFFCFAACTWVQILGISDIPHWTSTLQDSNLILKECIPFNLKKKKKVILKQPRQRFCDLQEEVCFRIINRASVPFLWNSKSLQVPWLGI